MSINKLLIIILLFICGYSLANDSDSLHYVQKSLIVNVKNYTMEDGLPSLNVKGGIQDSQGFLWFPTKFGLVYYDGNDFKTINKEKIGLNIERVFHLVEDNNGKIWLQHQSSHLKNEILDVKTLEIKNVEEIYPSIKKIKEQIVYFFRITISFIYLLKMASYIKKITITKLILFIMWKISADQFQTDI